MADDYELPETGRAQWKDHVTTLIAAAGTDQVQVAQVIQTRHGGGSKTSELGTFVNGDTRTLRNWFTKKQAYLQVFANVLKTTVDALRDAFQQCRLGLASTAPSWSADFPELKESEVEIPLSFVNARLERVFARRAIDELVAQGRPVCTIRITGDRTQDIALRQLREAAEAANARIDIRRASPDECPDLELAPWGPEEVERLAANIIKLNRLGTPDHTKIRAFAVAVRKDRTRLAFAKKPSLVVRLLGTVRNEGVPRDAAETIRRLCASEWSLITQESPSGRLRPWTEELAVAIWAACALRDDPARVWTSIPESTLRDVVLAAADQVAGPHSARRLRELVDAARTNKDKQAALDAIALEIDARHPGLFEALEEGLFRRVTEGTWSPVSTDFAACWAARRFLRNGAPPPLAAFADPAWDDIVKELGRQGQLPVDFLRWLGEVPLELYPDRARWIVRFAASSPHPFPSEALVPAWATTVYAAACGYLGDPEARLGWVRRIEGALTEVSHRFGAELPTLERDDLLTGVRRHVPEGVQALIEAWNSPDSEADEMVRRLAPGQVPVLENDPVLWWNNHRAEQTLLTWARRGDLKATRMLAGDIDEAYRQNWKQFSLDTRLDWAAKHCPSGHRGRKTLLGLAKEVNVDSEPRWAKAVALAGVETLAEEFAAYLNPAGRTPWPWGTLLAAAKHARAVEFLRLVAHRDGDLSPKFAWEHGYPYVRLAGKRHSIEPKWDANRLWPDTLATLEAEINTMRQHAHDAARALYELGEHKPLLDRWRDPPKPTLEPVVIDLLRVAGLACVLENPGELLQGELPVEALATLAPLETMPHFGQYARHGTAVAAIQECASQGGLVVGRASDAIRGICRLAHQGWDQDTPADLLNWLEGIGRRRLGFDDDPPQPVAVPQHEVLDTGLPDDEGLTDDTSIVEDRLEGRLQGAARGIADEAALELMRLGNPAPIQAWARGEDHPAVEQVILDSPKWLDIVWRASTASRRDVLLRAGSKNARDGADARQWPRPYVVHQALSSSGQEARLLAWSNRGSPETMRKVNEQLHATASGRDRAYFATVLGGDPLDDALRRWVAEPNPFVGPAGFTLDGDVWTGGSEELLDVVLAHDAAWVRDVIGPLWTAAVALPLARIEEATCLGRGDLPEVLRKLADRLVEAGQASTVVDTWRDPPGAPDERKLLLRRWLVPYAAHHATDAELVAAIENLDRPDGEILDALAIRVPAAVRRWAERHAAHSPWPSATLLARFAPDLLATAVDRIVSKDANEPPAGLRDFAWYADGAQGAVPGVGIAVRKILVRRTPDGGAL